MKQLREQLARGQERVNAIEIKNVITKDEQNRHEQTEHRRDNEVDYGYYFGNNTQPTPTPVTLQPTTLDSFYESSAAHVDVSVDPGLWLLWATIGYSLMLSLLVVLFLVLKKRGLMLVRGDDQMDESFGRNDEVDPGFSKSAQFQSECAIVASQGTGAKVSSNKEAGHVQSCMRNDTSSFDVPFVSLDTRPDETQFPTMSKAHRLQSWLARKARKFGGPGSSHWNTDQGKDPIVYKVDNSVIHNGQQAGETTQSLAMNDEEQFERALIESKSVKRSLFRMRAITYYRGIMRGTEARSFLKLAVALGAEEIVDGLVELITIVIIDHYIDDESAISYVMVQFLMRVSEFLVKGIFDAEYAAISQCVGARNEFLAGQYMQIAIISGFLYTACFSLLWVFHMDDILSMFGMSQRVARLGLEFAQVNIISYMVKNVECPYAVILDITDRARFNMTISVLERSFFLLVTWITISRQKEDMDLQLLGCIQATSELIFLVVHLRWVLAKRWLDPFWGGLVDNFAFTNLSVVKKLLKNGCVLAVGNVVADGEWEVLTIIAAYHGPLQVSAWVFLGTIWEVIESGTNGLAGAAEIRVARHLGDGSAKMAQVSACLCYFYGISMASIVSVLILLWGENLVSLLTSDDSLKTLLHDQFPLLAYGNVAMVVGMISQSVLEAQGRFWVSTFVPLMSSLLITIPLAAVLVYVFGINIQATTAAVVVGYSTSGTIFTLLLLQCDWDKLAEKIQRKNSDRECLTESTATISICDTRISPTQVTSAVVM